MNLDVCEVLTIGAHPVASPSEAVDCTETANSAKVVLGYPFEVASNGKPNSLLSENRDHVLYPWACPARGGSAVW